MIKTTKNAHGPVFLGHPLAMLLFCTVFFLRREPKRSLKIVQRSLKICFYNSVNKAKYAQEQ